MQDLVFTLPKDENGELVSEEQLRREYRLPHHTRLRRNLAIRFWYRAGLSVEEIMAQPICKDLKSPQSVYSIIKSTAYNYMEEKYGLR